MLGMRASLFLFVVALSIAPAQLAIGDIGVTGFWFTTPTQPFWILHANGTSTAYPLAGVTSTIQAILYDPSQPNTFLVGGSGFLGRATVTGPGTATYASITTSVGVVSQMSFDGSQLVVCDSGAGQMVRVDPVTGTITPITNGAQPWGANLNAGCIDPNTGDIYAGELNAIWRIPAASPTPVSFASGWTGSVSGLAIDPVSLQVVATILTYNHFVRISPAGILTNIAPSGPSGQNAVDLDANGDFIVGAGFGMTYRVPNAGGAPVLIGTPTGIAGGASGVSTVIERFHLNALATGSGGLSLALGGIPPGIVEGFTVASFDTSLQVGTGPIFGFLPDALSFALVLGSPTASPATRSTGRGL